MKKLYIFIFIFILISCSKKEYGISTGIKNESKIISLKQNPQNYINTMVKVRGKVIDESKKGAWITIKEEKNNKVIYVNFDYTPDIMLDKLMNKTVVIEGRFVKEREGYFIRGNWCKVLN